MENNNIEELNQNIEEVTEVTEETIEENTEEVNETVEQVEETVNEVEESTNEAEETTEEVIESTDEAIVESNDVQDTQNDDYKNSNIAQATIIGYTKLNVRKNPSKDSEVVCIITKDSSVTVNYDESTEDFYKVYVNVDNVPYEGFCMKEFISIK